MIIQDEDEEEISVTSIDKLITFKNTTHET